MEVYKLHFDHGVPATRIAEMMKVDRNTIKNDLKILYREALKDYDPDDMSLDDILQKQLLRLETQRDRLGLYLSDAKDINSKIAIERLMADIDFKLIGAIEKVYHKEGRFWDEIIKKINKIAENKKWDVRYTSLFELHKISTDSRKSLNKLMEDVLKEKKVDSE
jgi:Mn-dependent DtxR family transcriptional regulator